MLLLLVDATKQNIKVMSSSSTTTIVLMSIV